MAAFAPLLQDRPVRADPHDLRAVVDRRLSTLLPEGRGDDLSAALRYSLLAPGKRIRPILTILAAWEIGKQDLRALDAGCALEMVHAASLILDDLPAMDDATTRRGQPATHVRFGEDVAMLTAIALLSQAYATIGAMSDVSTDVRCRLIAILAGAVGPAGLAGGQLADLRPLSVDSLQAASEANRRKTGALFSAAAQMAAAIHGREDRGADFLHDCVDEIGQAYQILDDLADSTELRRDGLPEDDGKATILSLVGPDTARMRLRHHVEAALVGISPVGGLASYIRQLFAGMPVPAGPT